MIIFCIPHTPSNKKTNISRIPPTYIQLICIIPSHPEHNEKSLHHHNTHKKRYLNKPDMINTSAYFHQPISLFQTKAPLNNEQHKTIYLQTIQYIVTQLSHFYHPLTPHTSHRSTPPTRSPGLLFSPSSERPQRSVKKGRLFERSEFLPFSVVKEASRRKK